MGFQLDAHMFTSPPLLHLCGIRPISWGSAIHDAPIEEQPPIRQRTVHKTGALESRRGLLLVERCNLQRGTCYWYRPDPGIHLE
ncbi:hypothetical protein FH972_017126 [Carpinus fangiana]|uniref:Uncharacterized protein n=1 Tax=Carpinus fangiana TaxID=176857 RepID=A0A5N6RIA3_9ROSI|nr:hypothetical protein FH972_017126 [Carpinus fangiana]